MKRTFLFLSLLFTCFSVLRAEEEPAAFSEETIWNQIESKFTSWNDGIPTRYKSNILIQLKGQVSAEDSTIMNEYIAQLRTVVDKWMIELVPSSGNLVVEIDTTKDHGVSTKMDRQTGMEIIKTHNSIYINPTTPLIKRRKILYYNLMRSLVVLKNNRDESMYVKGCVFDEKSPDDISFHPIDMEILKLVYSNNFEEKQKQQITSNHSALYYVLKKFRYQLSFVFNVLGLAAAAAFLFFRLHKFKKPHSTYRSYMKQGSIVFISFLIYALISGAVRITTDSWATSILSTLGSTIPMALIGWIVITSTLYIIEKQLITPESSLLKKVLIPLFLTITLPVLITYTIELFSSKSSIIQFFITSAVLYFSSFIAILRALYIFLETKSQQIISEKDIQLARLGELNKQAELQSLQSKINPHFLYNSLNSIASLARTDALKTEKMALALSDFFKYSLNKEQKETVSLAEEIQSIETYLEIEKVRFGDRLNYSVQCPEELKKQMIPQFLVQPLIENAVKHGLSKNTGMGDIGLQISATEGKLEIAVFDNGPAFPEEPISGYGLQSIQEKLKLIYADNAYFSWQNKPYKKAIIILPILQK